jgi:uncharacterized integral membrane protein
MPFPLLLVVCIIGIVTTGIVIDMLLSIVRDVRSRRSKKTSPLSEREIQM